MVKTIGKKFFEILTKISPKLSAKVLYVYRTKQLPHLKKPRNFNDKTTVLKLSYKDNLKVSQCADKYEVREYVKSKGLEHILNELVITKDNFKSLLFRYLYS